MDLWQTILLIIALLLGASILGALWMAFVHSGRVDDEMSNKDNWGQW